MWEDVSKIKKGYSWSVDVFFAGDEECGFGAVVVGDGEDGVEAPRFREFGDEVERNGFEGKGVLWFDGEERGSCPVCVHFVCLALGTSLYIVCDKLFHVRPPVIAL